MPRRPPARKPPIWETLQDAIYACSQGKIEELDAVMVRVKRAYKEGAFSEEMLASLEHEAANTRAWIQGGRAASEAERDAAIAREREIEAYRKGSAGYRAELQLMATRARFPRG